MSLTKLAPLIHNPSADSFLWSWFSINIILYFISERKYSRGCFRRCNYFLAVECLSWNLVLYLATIVVMYRVYCAFIAVCVLVFDTISSVDKAPAYPARGWAPKGTRVFFVGFMGINSFFLTKRSILNSCYEK